MEARDDASDEDLVRRIRRGDEAAVNALFERHSARLRARVRRRLPAILRRKVAESDVIQEAWITACLRMEDFEDRGRGSFGHWIGRILANKVNDEIRRHLGTAKRNGREVSTPGESEPFPEPAAERPSPSEAASAREVRADVLRCIDDLAPTHRQILRWIHGDGLSQREVALRTGRPEATVRKAYARALAAFRRRMESSAPP